MSRARAFTVLLALLALIVLAARGLSSGDDANAAPLRLRAQAPSPSAPSEFLATVAVTPAVTHLAVGELLRVSTAVIIDPASTCGYATYEMTLRQSGADGALFEYVSPTGNRIGPPGAGSSAWVLRAVRAGTVVLDAQAYGEKNCGYWQWWYVYGQSAPVQVFVAGDGREAHLPIVLKEW